MHGLFGPTFLKSGLEELKKIQIWTFGSIFVKIGRSLRVGSVRNKWMGSKTSPVFKRYQASTPELMSSVLICQNCHSDVLVCTTNSNFENWPPERVHVKGFLIMNTQIVDKNRFFVKIMVVIQNFFKITFHVLVSIMWPKTHAIQYCVNYLNKICLDSFYASFGTTQRQQLTYRTDF